jgi:Flp pilus assembly protein TadG
MMQLMRHLWRKCAGAASIEFALIMPAMLLMFMGLFELSQGLIMYMKVIDVADTVSDLIAQQKSVASTDIDNYYVAGQLVMTPSPGAGLGLYVASITFDPVTGNASVAWSATRGGATAMSNAAAANAASGLGNKCANQGPPTPVNPCDSVILAQATYTYNSALGYVLQHSIPMSTNVFSRPRAVFSIPCTSSPSC